MRNRKSCRDNAPSYASLCNPLSAYNPVPSLGASLGTGTPIFSFGVVADVQYADIDDGESFGGSSRYYRHALDALKAAVRTWNQSNISFVAQLGDLVDGVNADSGESSVALATVQQVLGQSRCQTFLHLMGNHELYNFTREDLSTQSLILSDTRYRSYVPCQGYRFIVLDAFDISTIGWSQDHPHYLTALSQLRENNPNDITVDDGTVDWSVGLEGLGLRWMPYNGGLGVEQLVWLQQELDLAHRGSERVVVLSHLPVYPGATYPSCLMFNYDEVLDLLHSHDAQVVAVFAGHDHKGGYCQDGQGVHHVVFKSPLEAPPPRGCHSLVEVYDAAMLIHGYGWQESFALEFSPKTEVAQALMDADVERVASLVACPACTFGNSHGRTACEICGTSLS